MGSTAFENLRMTIKEHMKIKDYADVSRIIQEDYEAGRINIIEFVTLCNLQAKTIIGNIEIDKMTEEDLK